MRPAILVFAKAPRPGLVKTRLARTCGAERAAEIHHKMVSHLLTRLLADRTLEADLELHTDISTDAWSAFNVTQHLQTKGNLGERMYHALQRGRILIVGGDAPTVPLPFLKQLLESPADIALGPTTDGGYYAIHARRTHPDMFAGVEWSTARALEQTVTACRACGLAVETGETWFDIDTETDLERIRTESWLHL